MPHKSHLAALASTIFILAAPSVSRAQSELLPAQTKIVGKTLVQASIADFNNDTKNDIVVVSRDEQFVAILRGLGQGSFSNPTTFKVGRLPIAFAIFDADADGKLDIATANDGNPLPDGPSVSICLGDGLGGFPNITTISIAGAAAFPTGIAAGDLDGDGLVDLIISNGKSTSATWLRGLGNAQFDVPQSIDMGGRQSAILLNDYNSDGRLDIACVLSLVNKISVRLGVHGGFFPPVLYQNTAQTALRGFAQGNINNAGGVDLYTADPDGNGWLFANDGQGVFTPQTIAAHGPNVSQVAIGDCDGDGKPDLLASHGGAPTPQPHISYCKYSGDGSADAPIQFHTSAPPISLVTGNLDGLNAADVVTCDPDTLSISIFLASSKITIPSGPPIFAGTQYLTGGSGPRSVVMADFTGDGNPDIMAANEFTNTIGFMKGRGLDGLDDAIQLPVNSKPRLLAQADLNGDGIPDIVFSHLGPGAEVYYGLGNGNIVAGQSLFSGSQLGSIAIGEVNNDGRLDIVGVEQWQMDIWLNDGNGNFTPAPSQFISGVDPRGLALGDFDTDGANDAGIVFFASDAGAILFGDDAGGFGKVPPLTFSAGPAPTAILFGHFNQDASVDVAYTSSGSGDITVRYGDGAGGFWNDPVVVHNQGMPSDLKAIDLRAAGVDDLIANDPLGGKLRVNLKDLNGYGFLGPNMYPSKSYNSPSELGQGALAIGDFDSNMYADVVVCDATPWAGNISIYLNRGDGTFGFGDTGTNGGARVLGAADFDQDSRIDFAVGGYEGNLIIYKSGDAAFTEMTSVSLLSPIAALAIADLDLDGSLDVMCGLQDGTLMVLRGHLAGGQFSFTDVHSFAVGSIRSIVAYDLNGDGRADIAFSGENAQIGVMLAVTGANGPQFHDPVYIDSAGGSDALAAADFDHDGRGDLAASVTSAGIIQIFGGDGAGGFPNSGAIPLPSPSTFLLRDINGDATVDILATSALLRRMSAVTLAPDGTPSLYTHIPLNDTPSAIAVADVDVDSNLDAIVTYSNSDLASLFLGDGMGAFKALSSFPVGHGSAAVIVGSFDLQDTRPDLVIASDGSALVSLLRGAGQNIVKFQTNSSACSTGTPKATALGDLNKDGKKDTATVQQGSNNVTIQTSSSAGGTVCKGPYPVGTNPAAVAIADISADTNNDVIVVNSGSNDVSVLLGDGQGNLAPAVNYPAGTNPTALRIADMNNDGNLDIVVSNSSANASVTILLGNGNGTFGQTDSVGGMGTSATSLVTVDMNENGTPDLGTTDNNLGSVTIAKNPYETVAFTPGVLPSIIVAIIPVGNGPVSLNDTDLNHDGIRDLVCANTGSNNVAIILGAKHEFGFGAPSFVQTGIAPRGVSIGDFNRDGSPDLAVSNGGSNNVSILLGDGLGGIGIQFPVDIGTGGSPEGIAVGDLENDLRDDIIIPRGSNNDGVVTTVLNAAPYPAGVAFFGTGTPGCNGEHKLSVNSSPKLGNDYFSLLCTNGPPGSVGVAIITDVPNLVGGDLLGIQVETWINPALSIIIETPALFVDLNGDATSTPIPIRDIPDLVGKHLYGQAFFFWPPACFPSPQGFSSSNGLDFTIQP
ncbi:MAG: VCBS repeat-containing protein [Planctomycetes bacterium]|nr:VCBS repeat-containing protein [Planctomycetota bacterium]